MKTLVVLVILEFAALNAAVDPAPGLADERLAPPAAGAGVTPGALGPPAAGAGVTPGALGIPPAGVGVMRPPTGSTVGPRPPVVVVPQIIWVPGYWYWNGYQWVLVPGYWTYAY
jgi:hypothetical protein